MKIFKSYKTELDPNNAQAALLSKACGVARFTYNWGLARRIDEYAKTGKSSSGYDQCKQLNAIMDDEFPWMQGTPARTIQLALQFLDNAYKNFFSRVKAGEKPGFPRFKTKHKTTPSFSFNYCPVVKIGVNVPLIGLICLKEHGYIPPTINISGNYMKIKDGKVLRATIKQSGGGRWFISVLCEIEVPDPVMPSNAVDCIGIDLGLTTFATVSDGTKYEAPKHLKKALKKLRRVQRKQCRQTKGGKNRAKTNRKIANLHFKVACQRKDFLHKLTSMLVKTKPAKRYVIEDLNIKGMVQNRKLSRAISDVGWGAFGRQLTYKATDVIGAETIKADRWYPSSKTCCKCGVVKKVLLLSERMFHCEACGNVIDRDDNASQNLKQYGLKLPPVRREDTPVESAVSKKPQRNRKKTVQDC